MKFLIILIILVAWFIYTQVNVMKKTLYINDITQEPKYFLDHTSYLAKGVLTPTLCETLIKESRNLVYDITSEPVDDEPVY